MSPKGQKLALAGLVIFMLGLSNMDLPVWAQGQPVTFSAFGDIPYSDSEYAILQQYVTDHNRYSPSRFIAHIGDILQSRACGEDKYSAVADMMKGFAVPAYIVVGDNEYNDCNNPLQGFAYWNEYFLNFEQNFCGAPPTEHQSVRPENWAFVLDGVLFIGINLVGSEPFDQNEWDTRLQDDANWVSQQYQAKSSQVRAAVVFSQAWVSSNRALFFDQFRPASAAFGKPVLFVHGDLHTFKYDVKPFFDAKNVVRLEVPKGADEPPLEVTVTMNSNPQYAFTVQRSPWIGMPPYNMPPCVNAGANKTISSVSTTLQGQAVDDGDPTGVLTITWSKVSGPGTVTFGNANALSTTASFSANGNYVLRLTANDGALQKSDELVVGVNANIANAPAISSFAPTSGTVGTVVTIVGNNFLDASSVGFNGTAASFVVESDTQIEATVPVGATTGKISVTNSTDTGISANDFVVTTGGGGNALTFYPTGDAYVQSLNAAANFGAEPDLYVEMNSPSDQVNTYMKFAVSGVEGPVQSAKLRLLVTDASSEGGSVFVVSNNYQGTSTPWVESGLVWNNAPLITGSALSSLEDVDEGQVVEFDVTAAITGNGIFSFAMKSSNSNSAEYSSKEGDAPPELIVQMALPSVNHKETRTGGSANATAVTTSASLLAANGHLYLAAVSTQLKVNVLAVSGLGLNWTLVKRQCSGINTTNVEVWMAQGTPSGNDFVTATLASAPSAAVIAVSRYSGVDAVDPIGNVVSGNTIGMNGSAVCAGGVASAAYSFNLATAVDGALVYGAVAIKSRTHSPGAGYTERAEIQQVGGSLTSAIAVGDKKIPAAANASVDGLLSGTADWAMVALEIRPESAGPAQYTLTMNTIGSGSVALDPADGVYSPGTVVTLTATPAAGHQFSAWSGDLTGSTNPATVTMDGYKNITATFVEIPASGSIVHEETRTGGSSNATAVTTSASLLAANGHLYLAAISTQLKVNVVSVSGLGLNWTLVKKQCSGVNTTGVEIWMAQGTPSGNGFVTATLANAPSVAVIAVSRYSGVNTVNPLGNVISGNTNGMNGSAACSGSAASAAYSFNLATTVDGAAVYGAVAIKARTHTPGAGYTERAEIQQVGGSLTSAIAVEDKKIAAATNVTINGLLNGMADWAMAALEIRPQTAGPLRYALMVNMVGSGNVALDPPGGVYDAGTVVTLTATPAADHQFSGWSGDLTGSTNPATVTMDGYKNITATFAANPASGAIVHEETRTGGSANATTVTTSASLIAANGHLYLAAISTQLKVNVLAVSGLGLNWTLVKRQCSGINTTGVEVWMAQGTPSGNGFVTATLASAPSAAVIAVSRYSGVAVLNPLGNVISGNTNGMNGSAACSGGVASAAYSFNMATTVDDAVVYGAVTIKARTHTPGAGYAERAEIKQIGGSLTSAIAVEDKQIAVAANVAVDGSLSGTADWAMVALEIKPQIAAIKRAEIAATENMAPPAFFQLEQNYPNPFNPSTQIRFGLPRESHVTIKVYTINGVESQILVDRVYPAGSHAIMFHANNLSSGTYFYVMQAGEIREVRRFVLVK